MQEPDEGVQRGIVKHRQKLHIIYEDYTSKLSSCCEKILQPTYGQDKRAIRAV